MKLTKRQYVFKHRLDELVQFFGFNTVREMTGLSGSTLGQYASLDSPLLIPESKLNYLEAEFKSFSTKHNSWFSDTNLKYISYAIFKSKALKYILFLLIHLSNISKYSIVILLATDKVCKSNNA